jgi:hypothetical protein
VNDALRQIVASKKAAGSYRARGDFDVRAVWDPNVDAVGCAQHELRSPADRAHNARAERDVTRAHERDVERAPTPFFFRFAKSWSIAAYDSHVPAASNAQRLRQRSAPNSDRIAHSSTQRGGRCTFSIFAAIRAAASTSPTSTRTSGCTGASYEMPTPGACATAPA